MKDYEITIGLEVHAELDTNSKVFCSCANRFGAEPNTNCCPVCIGLPGALPVLNKKAVELVIKAGLALGCEINDLAVFERKNYFYPDLSKAYQISQLVRPICLGGELEADGAVVHLNRIHLEEDAGKLTHVSEGVGTLIDYNRGGVPLMELVTEPDIHSSTQAVDFLTKLREVLIYAGVAQCKMEQGGMRCDVNVSVSPKGSGKLGNRTEMKNLNSFRSVQRAIEYEADRQIEILEAGGIIEQETRKWDDDAGISYCMRKKDNSNDYRYFPDPDLLAVEITREQVEKIRKTLPILPQQLKQKYVEEFGLTPYDADIIVKDMSLTKYFEDVLAVANYPKTVANWIITEVLSRKTGAEIALPATELAKIVDSLETGKITRKVAKDIFASAYDNGESVDELVKKLGGSVDSGELEKFIDHIIDANPKAVADYKASADKTKQSKWFVGQVMRETRGKADPVLAEKLIIEKLNK